MILEYSIESQSDAAIDDLPHQGWIQSSVKACVMSKVLVTPPSYIISLPTAKGERLTFVFPAVSFLDWIITLMQSIGWMTQVAMQPEMDPTVKGLTSDMRVLSLGLSTLRVIRMLYNKMIRKKDCHIYSSNELYDVFSILSWTQVISDSLYEVIIT